MDNAIIVNDIKINEEQMSFYNENGYGVIEGLFSDSECQKMKDMAESIAEDDYCVTLNIHRKVDAFMDVMKNPIIVNIVESVQRNKVVGLNSQYLYKKAGTPYAKQSWTPHQDISYINGKKGTYIIFHIFVDENEKENGGIYFYPGSHEEDILPFKKNKSWRENFDDEGISHPGATIEVPPKYEKSDVNAPKGSICLMHGNVIHGSYPNLTINRSRQQYSMGYLNEGSNFYAGKTSIKEVVTLK